MLALIYIFMVGEVCLERVICCHELFPLWSCKPFANNVNPDHAASVGVAYDKSLKAVSLNFEENLHKSKSIIRNIFGFNHFILPCYIPLESSRRDNSNIMSHDNVK
jgi:hypothetical protein